MSHSFLKESKLFIVYGTKKYRIHTTSAITFSQTFAEDSYPVKTLHDQSKMFEGSTITKANEAEFSFEVPLTVEKDESIVMDLLSDLVVTSESDIESQQLKSFDMFVQTGSSTFKTANCVITSSTFNFNPREQFKVTLQGQGTQLTRAGNESFNIETSYTPNKTVESQQLTRTPVLVYPAVTLDSLNTDSILSVTLTIQNDIEWSPYETLQQSVNGNMMFPSAYTVQKRSVSGTIQQYQTDNNITQFDDFSTSSNLIIKAKLGSNNTDFWQIQLNPVMFTSRMEVAEVYIQSYDFRSLDNTALATRITTYS